MYVKIILTGLFLVIGISAHAAILRSEYLFNEGFGTTATDGTGNLDGVISGAAYSSDTPLGGSGNFALSFDGDDVVNIGSSANLAFPSISIEVWVNPEDVTNNKGIFAIGQSSSNVGLIIGPRSGVNVLVGQVGDGTNDSFLNVHGGVLPLNEWSHIALTFDGVTNTARMYVNGVQTSEFLQNNPISYREDLPAVIGGFSDRSTLRWIGLIDDVRIFEGVRTDTEILFASTGTSVPEPSTWLLSFIAFLSVRRIFRAR